MKQIAILYLFQQELKHNLYAHIYRLPQAVHWVSVGLDVAHTQSRHLHERAGQRD